VSNKQLMITVRGERSTWSFQFMGDPRHIEEWRADGLEVHEVCNVIPEWVASFGLSRGWCFAQDIFNFKNPWGNK